MVADQGLLPPLARIVQVMNGHLPGVENECRAPEQRETDDRRRETPEERA